MYKKHKYDRRVSYIYLDIFVELHVYTGMKRIISDKSIDPNLPIEKFEAVNNSENISVGINFE